MAASPSQATEAAAIDGAIHDAGGGDFVGPQGGQEGQSLPMPVRHLGVQPLTARATPMRARHVRLGPGLVNENQTPWIDFILSCSAGSTVFLKLIPSDWKNRDSVPVSARTPRSSHKHRLKAASVMSGCTWIVAKSQARSGFTFEGRCPPVPAQRRSPTRLARCNYLIADASLTPNRRAAERQLSEPLSTTSITRSRKSWE